MTIVCLLTVGAFLLPISIADSEMPNVASHYQPRQRPLMPVLKIKLNNENRPLDWLLNMVSRVLEPPKPSPPSMIGPIALPGKGGHLMIRPFDNPLTPWDNTRVVIKLLTPEPTNAYALTSSPGGPSYHHRSAERSRIVANNPHGYQTPIKDHSSRTQNSISQSGFVPISPQPQYSPWRANHLQHPNFQQRYQHQNPPAQQQYSQPFRPSSPNDFHHDNRVKETVDRDRMNGHVEDYFRGRSNPTTNHQTFNPGHERPMNGPPPMYPLNAPVYTAMTEKNPYHFATYPTVSYGDRLDGTRHTGREANERTNVRATVGKPDYPTVTQLPYPEYPPASTDHFDPTARPDNVSRIESTSAKTFYDSPGYYGRSSRTDRMVIAEGHRNDLSRGVPRSEGGNFAERGSYGREFREGTRHGTKFGVKDVGGIEVVTAPDLRDVWGDYNGARSVEEDDVRSDSTESESTGTIGTADFVVAREGKTSKVEEVDGRSNENTDMRTEDVRADEGAGISKRKNPRRSSYKVIDRNHRNRDGRDNSTAENNDFRVIFESVKIDGTKNPETQGESELGGVEKEGLGRNGTAEFAVKVVDPGSNTVRRTLGRPRRVVKAIYRRKPVTGIIKSTEEFIESGNSSAKNSTEDNSSSEI